MVTLGGVSSIALNVLILISGIVVFGGITIGIIFASRHYKRYSQFNVMIFSNDNITGSLDKGGIFVDNKTKNKRFFLKKYNVGLEPDNVPFKVIGKKRWVFLFQEGLKNFKFCNIEIEGKPTPGASISVSEEDVNWAINAYERQKKLFQQSALLQYMPYIALFFVSIIILVMFMYFFKDFEVLRDVAIALKETSQNTLRANGVIS